VKAQDDGRHPRFDVGFVVVNVFSPPSYIAGKINLIIIETKQTAAALGKNPFLYNYCQILLTS